MSNLAQAQISVSPIAVVLDRPEASQQILVTDQAEARDADLTRKVQYAVADPAIARVDSDGMVFPLSEGATEVVVLRGSDRLIVPVRVTELMQPPPVSFQYEIQPILTKTRCNSGGCHGKAEGQNGFKLESVWIR